MSDTPSHNQVSVTEKDVSATNNVEIILKIIHTQIDQSKDLNYISERWDLVARIRKEAADLAYQEKMQALEVEKEKINVRFNKIYRIISLVIGTGLFISSFFVYKYYAPIVGGVFFGTGLAALRVRTISTKFFLRSNDNI